MGEFDIIERHFAPLARNAPLAFGLGDDAAMIEPAKGFSLVVTADAIVEGVHYLPDDPPEKVARKLLRANLSDLAAKGARPRGYLLTAGFSISQGEAWIASFARGLAMDQKRFGLDLIGGDTVRTPGPAQFGATMYGEIKGVMILRSGAQVGDVICVTGAIGDGGFGLDEIRKPHPGLSEAQRRYLATRYRLPQPRLRMAPIIAAYASAALDVSDGLVQDLGHMARRSGVRIVLDEAAVPLSPAGRIIARDDPKALGRALTAGDDYEIVFAAPPARIPAIRDAARAARVPVHAIGVVERGEGVAIRAADGRFRAPDPDAGYDHFRAGR